MADLDHRAHALRLAAALGASVDLERGEGGLLSVAVERAAARQTIATNASERRHAWRWAAEHLARQECGGEAFDAARRDYERAARADFEGRGVGRAEGQVGP